MYKYNVEYNDDVFSIDLPDELFDDIATQLKNGNEFIVVNKSNDLYDAKLIFKSSLLVRIVLATENKNECETEINDTRVPNTNKKQTNLLFRLWKYWLG